MSTSTARRPVRRLYPLLGLLAVVGAGIVPCHWGPSPAEAQSNPPAPVDIRVALTEWALTPAQVTVPAGRTVRLLAVNAGILPHALAVEGQDMYVETDIVGAGQSAPLEITFNVPGVYDLFCPVNAGQHRALGQEGVLTVTATNLPFLLPRTGEDEPQPGEDGTELTTDEVTVAIDDDMLRVEVGRGAEADMPLIDPIEEISAMLMGAEA